MTPKYLEAWRNSMGITAIGSDKKTPLFKSLENDLELATEVIKRFNDHAALVAVAEAAKRIPQWLGKAQAENAFAGCVCSPDSDIARLDNALANLAAVRGGKVVGA